MSAVVLICATLMMSDGDSGRCVTADGERHRVRLAGIDAGEVAPFTRCPAAGCLGLLASRPVHGFGRGCPRPSAGQRRRPCTITDTDRYRRNVAVCTVRGRDLGAQLVREGLAISETNFGDPYRREENAARRERRGVWR